MVLGSIARVLFLTALIAANAAPAFSKTITIGILDTIDPWFYVQTFGPTMEHLRKVIPQYEIKSVELSFEKLQKAIKAGELDFFIAPSGFFAVNFQRFPTLDAKKLVNAPKMSAHHRGICHF